jgi:ERCC4 domain
VACDRARLLPPLRPGLPTQAEIIEQTPVLLCRRRGAAIDLVLDRPRLARSQFVFTQVKGREAIFWQTQKTARAANPGGRIPRRRPLADAVTIAVDTRERYPYRFAQQSAETVRATVPAGDYAIHAPDGSVLAVVERKSLETLAATLPDGTLAFQRCNGSPSSRSPPPSSKPGTRHSSSWSTSTATGSPTNWPGSRCATPKSTSSSPTPAASPKSGHTASSAEHSPTHPARTRTAATLRVVNRHPRTWPDSVNRSFGSPQGHGRQEPESTTRSSSAMYSST